MRFETVQKMRLVEQEQCDWNMRLLGDMGDCLWIDIIKERKENLTP